MTAGREAALDDLGLEHVGLTPTGGRLTHDEGMRTTNPDIYIAGDSTGTYQILHLANQEGIVAGANAAAGERVRTMDYRLKMSDDLHRPALCPGRPERDGSRAPGQRDRPVWSAEPASPRPGARSRWARSTACGRSIADRQDPAEILGDVDPRPPGRRPGSPRSSTLMHYMAAALAGPPRTPLVSPDALRGDDEPGSGYRPADCLDKTAS